MNDNETSVVELHNYELNEQLMLINQLDDDEKNALITIINSMLTKKRMKDLLDCKVKLYFFFCLIQQLFTASKIEIGRASCRERV